MSHSYCICQRVWKWQQCCSRAQDQYVLDPVSKKWKKKNQSWNNHLSAASLHTVAGTFTLAINCHLAGVLLKLTNCRKTDWRSESINHNNLSLQWFSHPVCVWCRSATGSECILIPPMAPSGLEFKGIDHHSKGRPRSKCSWNTNSVARDTQRNVNHPLPNSSGYHRLQIWDNHVL